MKVIRPNCRVQFTAEDIDFVLHILSPGTDPNPSLIRLLADEETRDHILDDERLYQSLLQGSGCLQVSTHLYFYVLVRRVLRKAGIEDRRVADYVAELLAEFTQLERLNFQLATDFNPLEYLFEMMAALQQADERTSFLIRAHIGNHSLFLSGVFPDRIRHRAEKKGFPDLSYYEGMGRSNFRVASDHRLARHYELTPVFSTLSECFHETRQALNDLAERLLHLGDPMHSDALLVKAFAKPQS
ncbi:MAG: hypothetical protein ACO1QS_14925 [Verrucomicrobiota bacterium]